MRKVNKILMATVSILLCLVLISTSVVSGIFAKYAINNKGKATASLKAFGVTLDMTVDEEALEDAGAEVETAEDHYEVTKSVTITGLKMAPGVTLDDVIRVAVDGTQNVRFNFIVNIDIQIHEKFLVKTDNFSTLNANTAYMPIQFMVGNIANINADTYTNSLYTNAWVNAPSVSSLRINLLSYTDKLSTNIKECLGTTLTPTFGQTKGLTVKKAFPLGNTIAFKDNNKGLCFGFKWDFSSSAQNDRIEMWLAEQFGADDVPITVTYTFSLEQY